MNDNESSGAGDPQLAAFYQTIDAYERAVGHKAASFDVWLLARGRMDTTGRRTVLRRKAKEQS